VSVRLCESERESESVSVRVCESESVKLDKSSLILPCVSGVPCGESVSV
jgi:hypothetical protein